MTYSRKYSRKRRTRRSGSGFGGAVGDTIEIAAFFGPRGVLITGCLGFATFYLLIPWLLAAWADHVKANMSNGVVGAAMAHMIDAIFIRRFIHPSEWAAIAILVSCLLLACWKAATRTDLDYQSQRDMTWLAKLLARFLD